MSADFNNKKILVAGAGLSGISAARLLLSAGASVVIRDANEKLEESALRKRMEEEFDIARAKGISSGGDAGNLSFCLGRDDYADISGLDLIVVSPGIPIDGDFMKPYMESKVPVWGEVELAYAFEKGKVMAITGTNGKTTTTALLGKIMKDFLGDDKALVVGNIGDPYTREVQLSSEGSVTVAEISSFMLETTRDFAPVVCSVLNITPDHLDRHHTMDGYAAAKERIFEKQSGSDTLVVNAEDIRTYEFGKRTKGKTIYFSSKKSVEEGLYYENGVIYTTVGGTREALVREDEVKIVGLHNMENIMGAAAMAIAYGVPLDSLRKSIKEFTAVEHRIEYVTEAEGVIYYNDSKGTNPDAAIKGIEAMTRPTILLGGGYDKGSEYDEWIEACKGRVKALVLTGVTAEKIRDCAIKHGLTDIYVEDTFEASMKRAFSLEEKGDAVLLSPACASWGQFPNFEVRGKVFKEMVLEHTKK